MNKKANKKELKKHFRWLLANVQVYACGFTKEEQKLNKQIYEMIEELED